MRTMRHTNASSFACRECGLKSRRNQVAPIVRKLELTLQSRVSGLG